MSLKYFGILLAIFAVESAVGQDPTIQIKYKKLDAKINDNPYFKTAIPDITNSGVEGSLKFTFVKPIPETTSIFLAVELKGEAVFEYEDLLCELMKNKIYGEDMLKHGLPADKFPTSCPATPGDYEISKYPIPEDKFPPGTPPGEYNAKLLIGESATEPWMIIDALIEISHDIPGAPIPKLGR